MRYEIHPDLDRILAKLAKRDRVQFEAILSKIDDIIRTGNIDHYKNLRAPLQRYKRVHVRGGFVLLFRMEGDALLFRHYDHHDSVYQFPD